MTDAGYAAPPGRAAPFTIPPDIVAALHGEPAAWAHFAACPALYQRIRVSYIDEARTRPEEFARRLRNLVAKSAAGEMVGNWTDGGRLG